MHSKIHNTARFFAAIAIGAFIGLAGPAASAFADGASHFSTTDSSAGSNNVNNPLAPSSKGAVGAIDTRMPVIPVGQQEVNCHLTNHKGVDCQ